MARARAALGVRAGDARAVREYVNVQWSTPRAHERREADHEEAAPVCRVYVGGGEADEEELL